MNTTCFITKFHLHVSANLGHPQGELLQNTVQSCMVIRL